LSKRKTFGNILNKLNNIRGEMYMTVLTDSPRKSKPTIDYRHYAKQRMAMRKNLHWPTHCWDGTKLRKLHLRDYLKFFKILILEGAEGIKNPKKEWKR